MVNGYHDHPMAKYNHMMVGRMKICKGRGDKWRAARMKKATTMEQM